MTYEEAYDWCVQFENNVIAYSKDIKRTALALKAMRVCRKLLEEKMLKG